MTVTTSPFIDELRSTFSDQSLLDQSLAHRSWCAENEGKASNERLEFLGDAVLGLIVTTYIYNEYPDLPEGELAKVRASVVNTTTLAEIAADLHLGAALLLGKGEDQSGGRHKPSILADATEAVIGAVYLDAGWDRARELVLELLSGRIADASSGPGGQDFKTRLQELAAKQFTELPKYEITEIGPDHAKVFTATVYISNQEQGTGEGRSKKQAEQEAARAAWSKLAAVSEETK